VPLRRHFGTLFNRHRHFTTQKPDRSLIGPFNALPHFPAYGTPVWDLFLALAGNSVLPKAAREVVILATAARFGSLYELYSHEAVAAKSGLPASKIRTIAVGLVGQFMSYSGL
jgi:4-carboxymuconolactone decarboxylase